MTDFIAQYISDLKKEVDELRIECEQLKAEKRESAERKKQKLIDELDSFRTIRQRPLPPPSKETTPDNPACTPESSG